MWNDPVAFILLEASWVWITEITMSICRESYVSSQIARHSFPSVICLKPGEVPESKIELKTFSSWIWVQFQTKFQNQKKTIKLVELTSSEVIKYEIYVTVDNPDNPMGKYAVISKNNPQNPRSEVPIEQYVMVRRCCHRTLEFDVWRILRMLVTKC